MTEEILERLARIDDPTLGDDVVSLGLIGDVDVDDGVAHVPLAFGAPYSPAETAIAESVRDAIRAAGYEPSLSIVIDDPTPAGTVDDAPNVIAVASGAGGVGKSTVAVNLATAIAQRGAPVGLFDADIFGPNAPCMLGVHDHPAVAMGDGPIPPLERYDVQLMSVGFLVGDDDTGRSRGPMVGEVLTRLWHDVAWDDLDYLVVDLPPGTGAVQRSILQQLPVVGSVVVTTSQDVALDTGRQCVRMHDEYDAHVLGVVENMSTFVCPDCGDEHGVVDVDVGEVLADEHEVPFFGRIQLDPSIRASSEDGVPIVLRDGASASAFVDLALDVMDRVGEVRRRSHRMPATDEPTSPVP